MTDKLFDDNIRRKLISTMDFKTLNDYLKNMDRMAKRKGGKYLEIYNKDLEYTMTLTDTEYQDEGNIFSLSGIQNNNINNTNNNDSSDEEKQTTMTEQVCDTEAYVQRINNIINKTPQKETELNLIKTKITKNNDKNCIYRFIDIIKSIDNSLTQNEYNLIKELTKIITKDKILIKDAFDYMGKALGKTDVSQEFIQKLSELRSKKTKMSKQQYNNEKDILIKNYIKKSGFKTVCISKLVEKIIYTSRKQQ